MAKLRHLGIRTEDTGKLASFYVDVFDMKVIHKSKEEGGTIFLSDGYFNLAIIPNKDQNATNGLYHFGFEVENGEAIVEKMKKINPNKLPKPRPNGRPYAEIRGSDPDGNYFDVWLPELAPSAPLVSWALSEPFTPKRWAAYARRYRREMLKPASRRLIALLAALSSRTNFSVGCYCEDESRCHRSLLKQLLIDGGAQATGSLP